MRQKVLATCHDEPTKGHTGIHKNVGTGQREILVEGHGMRRRTICMRNCPVCQIMKSDH